MTKAFSSLVNVGSVRGLSCLLGISLVVNEIPLTAGDQTLSEPYQKPTKLTRITPWQEMTIRFVVPASSTAKGKFVEAEALRATYRSHIDPHHFVVSGEDPSTNRTFVIFAPFDVIYISRPSGIMACGIGSGSLYLCDPYVEVAEPSGNLTAAISRFETGFDSLKLEAEFLKRVHRIVLKQAAPKGFFQTTPHRNIGLNDPSWIEAAEITENILRLDLRNPETRQAVSIWIDLDERKPIRSVADGKELELPKDARWSHEFRPFNETNRIPFMRAADQQ